MEDTDLEQIKASLLEEQRLETELKKEPTSSDGILPLLHSLYIARMNLERANWGCSVDRERFSLLKSSLLEEAHLEGLVGQESQTDTDLQKLLKIAKNKSGIYVSELEANLDPTVACPLLPTRELPNTHLAKPLQKEKKSTARSTVNAKPETKAEAKPKEEEKGLRNKEKRRQMIRYILSSTK